VASAHRDGKFAEQPGDALWQSGGEEAVTIRGVAAEAATTTPTVIATTLTGEALA
jgi:hypothetical protein